MKKLRIFNKMYLINIYKYIVRGKIIILITVRRIKNIIFSIISKINIDKIIDFKILIID